MADSEDTEDFSAKLQSLQQIWESLGPGFYSWFFKYHAQKFKECFTRLTQEHLEINTRYYNNNLELKHRQQKKKLRDLNISGDISQVAGALEKWIEENYYNEIVLAIRGLGKYRLAPGFTVFLVESVLWSRWSTGKREQNMKRFFEFTPKPSETYQKPANGGKKSNRDASSKRRCLEPEPELFVDRIADKGTITPIKLAKSKNLANDWEKYKFK